MKSLSTFTSTTVERLLSFSHELLQWTRPVKDMRCFSIVHVHLGFVYQAIVCLKLLLYYCYSLCYVWSWTINVSSRCSCWFFGPQCTCQFTENVITEQKAEPFCNHCYCLHWWFPTGQLWAGLWVFVIPTRDGDEGFWRLSWFKEGQKRSIWCKQDEQYFVQYVRGPCHNSNVITIEKENTFIFNFFFTKMCAILKIVATSVARIPLILLEYLH